MHITANSEDPAFHQGLHFCKDEKEYNLHLEIMTCDILVCNGPPQVYFVKPEGRIHQCIKGYISKTVYVLCPTIKYREQFLAIQYLWFPL